MYSCPSVLVCVCLSVCVSGCVHENTKNNCSIHLKLEHTVVYENRSTLGIVRSRSRPPCDVKFSLFTTVQIASPISQLWHMLGSCD